MQRRVWSDRAALAGILLIFVCLGVWYSLAVPAFEKPDEVHYYAFARALAQGNPLPVLTAGENGPWSYEGGQAPLYFMLVGRLTAAIDQSDFDQLAVTNPHANLGNPAFPGNKNAMLYSARPRSLIGANLALHVGRWFSLALGCVTIILVYLTARFAFPGGSALPVLCALLVASIPQFAFISTSVSNDSMITVTSVAVIYWLARLVARGKTEPIVWWEWGFLGILLGLTVLSKLHGLALVAPVGLVILWSAWQRRSWRQLFISTALVALPALAIAGWWYWRNFRLYGEWTGSRQLLIINGLRSTPRSWRGFVGEMRGLRYSFWAMFGWFSIMLPVWVYRTLEAVTILSLAGLVVIAVKGWLARRWTLFASPAARVKLLLAFWVAMLIAAILYWSTFAVSSQGRQFFPAVSAFAILMVTGWGFWVAFLPRRWRFPAQLLLPVSLIGCSLYALIFILPAAYRAPAPVSALPAGATALNLTYDNQIELVGIDLPEGRFKPGESVPVTLYLRSQQEPAADWPLFIQLLDEKAGVLGNITTHPGWGRNPTSLWQPGALYADRYAIPVTGRLNDSSPLAASVYVGFTQLDSDLPLSVHASNGAESSGMVGVVDLVPAHQTTVSGSGLEPVAVAFDDGIRLIGQRHPSDITRAEGPLPVSLLWEAAGAPGQDYVAFVHLLDANGQRVAGYDQPPAAGRFPTRRWRSGDRILSELAFALPSDLPPGAYELWAGLYPEASRGQSRLPVTTSDRPQRDQSVLLGAVEVR